MKASCHVTAFRQGFKVSREQYIHHLNSVSSVSAEMYFNLRGIPKVEPTVKKCCSVTISVLLQMRDRHVSCVSQHLLPTSMFSRLFRVVEHTLSV